MLKINEERLKNNLETLGKIGATAAGGVSRFTYSTSYFEGVKFLQSHMENAGLTVCVDPIGNVIGSRAGKTDQILLLGSHIDSVPNAGIFDGCLGVLAAIEAMEILQEQGIQLQHTVQVVAWAEEEGNTVVGLLGSGSFVGKMDDLTDVALRKMEQFGLTRDHIRASRSPNLGRIDASLELHIEQGGVLEREQTNIGVVNGIVGIERYEVCILGVKNHAGTTPMSLRDDAMVKAAKLIVELDALARKTDCTMVCTVGCIQAFPGVANVIPERVVMTVECRAMEPDSIKIIRQYILERFPQGQCTMRMLFHQAPVPMARCCKDAISRAATQLGLSQRVMNSGAGHDTMILAESIPACGMIFVPSIGGVSHCPQEWTEWKDAAGGANVLLNALLNLDAMHQ